MDSPSSEVKVRYEYRVVWRRHGFHQKMKRFQHLKSAEKRAMLLGPEPWKALALDPDETCCSGLECACGGRTHREILLAQRNEPRHPDDGPMPSIEYLRIEKRRLAPWEPV